MSDDLAAVGNLRFTACVIAGYCSDMESVMKKKTGVTLLMGWLFLLSGCADRAAQIQMTTLSVLTGKAEAFPDTVFELGYHQRFGICGTGVTTERMELPDGRTGWRYSEIMNTEQMLWLTIVFDRPEESEETGTYVLMASPELSVWEQIEPEFEGILESVRMENPADG